MYTLNNFFIYSILGFIFETINYVIFGFHGESGILFGPWTPVYGFGVIIAFYINKKLERKYQNKKIKNILLFFITAILLTILEQIGGMIIENVWHTSYWDYTKLKFNLGKYISLETSLLWGIGSVLITNFLKKYTDKLNKKIPKCITYILTFAIIIDGILALLIK